MRIGVFTDSYKPYVSGVVRSIMTFSAHLSQLGHTVFIFAPGYPRTGTEEDNVFRFFSLPAITYRDFRVGVPVSLRLRRTLADLHLDLVHVHSPFLMGQAGVRLARRLHLPLVFTYHTLYHKYTHYVPVGRGFSSRLVLQWSLKFCDHCDLVIAPTPSIASFLREQGVRRPITVIPTGIEVEEFRRGDPGWLAKRIGPRREGESRLLFVGRLGAEKNLFFLLRAFRRIAGRIPGARLILAGDGPARGDLQALAARLGLTDRIIFLGRVVEREVAHCYAGADLFVFPSLTETQGLVIGEAMAAGLPVVALEASGSRDLIENGREGFLCQPSEEEFARAVEAIIRDGGLRARMSAAARDRSSRLSARATTLQLVRVYEQLLHAGSVRRTVGAHR